MEGGGVRGNEEGQWHSKDSREGLIGGPTTSVKTDNKSSKQAENNTIIGNEPTKNIGAPLWLHHEEGCNKKRMIIKSWN